MAFSSLFTLIDDIASILDDVALMTKTAAKKTVGVVGDDLALNANQVAGAGAERELPIVWAVAKGSFINKAVLIPIALLLSAFLPVVLLSGFIFELNSMPFVQRAIAAVLPARYLVTCLQTLFLAGDVWPLLIPNMIRLGLLGLFFLAATLRYTKKMLA